MDQIPSFKPVVRQVNPAVQNQLSAGMAKRVCAYCRVSTESVQQQSSYELQVSHYRDLINKHEEWIFAGIYADEGISGTSTKNRDQFKQMIQDCMDGKLDMILTKSISRFARNTLDCLKYVRKLKSLPHPVGIYFERENIDTLDAKSELLLTILSSLAQDESRNISENVKWANQSRYQQGYVHCPTANFLGYDKDAQGNWLINEKQAETVRRIYRECLEGYGTFSIARHLTEDRIQTGSGRTKWSANSVHRILRNEKYCGDAIMQKRVTVDFLTHRRITNRGFQPQYYIENHHPAIISREEWQAVQRELSRRYLLNHPVAEKGEKGPVKIRSSCRSVFSNKFFCDHCGAPFQRRSIRTSLQGKSMRYPIWKCRNAEHPNTSSVCCSSVFKEEALQSAFMELLFDMKHEKYQLQSELYKSVQNQWRPLPQLQTTFNWFIEQLDTIPDFDPKFGTIPFREDLFLRTIEQGIISEHTIEYTFVFGIHRKINIRDHKIQ